MEAITVDLEFTPNPNSLKYVTSVTLLEKGVLSYAKVEDAEGRSNLALDLFALDGVAGVMIGKNFVTVTLASQDGLTQVNDAIIATIKTFMASGKPVAEAAAFAVTSTGAATTDVEKKIVEILERDIRPAVAMDGGDITFDRYQDGIVFLQMKGACAGCPSSTLTLKMGIENRLREAIPEIIEVVSV
jgi:Fe-S cluster biogenesis protein NfuA